MIKPQMIVVLVGCWLLIVGSFGYVAEHQPKDTEDVQLPATASYLRVVEGHGKPTSTGAQSLQGATKLQSQSSPLQTSVGDQLQPNAGAENLPKNY